MTALALSYIFTSHTPLRERIRDLDIRIPSERLVEKHINDTIDRLRPTQFMKFWFSIYTILTWLSFTRPVFLLTKHFHSYFGGIAIATAIVIIGRHYVIDYNAPLWQHYLIFGPLICWGLAVLGFVILCPLYGSTLFDEWMSMSPRRFGTEFVPAAVLEKITVVQQLPGVRLRIWYIARDPVLMAETGYLWWHERVPLHVWGSNVPQLDDERQYNL